MNTQTDKTIIQTAIKVGQPDNFIEVTGKQAEAFDRILKHQGEENYTGAYVGFCEQTLMVTFKHIVIGIEPDGYAHS